MAGPKTEKALQKQIKLKQQNIVATEKILASEQQILATARQHNLTLEQQQDLNKKIISTEGQIVRDLNAIATAQQKIVDLLAKELADAKAKGTLTSAAMAAKAKELADAKVSASLAADESRELARQNELRKKALQVVDKLKSKTQELVKSLTGIHAGWKDTFIGSLVQATQTMGSLKGVTSSTFAAFSEATSFANILGSTLMKVQESTIGMIHTLDQTTVSFRKATGAGTEYNSRILSVFESNRRFGISLQEAGAAFEGLRSHMTAFTGYGARMQSDLASVGAMLGKVGIDIKTYSANMDTMTKVFGMSAGQAKQFSMDFAELGSKIGIPPAELARQLNGLTPRMAMFTRTATTELRKLAAQSKSTGIEMQRLIGIAQGFDTFSGAAEKVGQLNAILGGPYLNTIQMMMATDTERIEIMKRAISSTGMMGEIMMGTSAKARMLRKALADVGGFGGDVDKMMRILGNDLNEFSSDAMNAAGSLQSLQRRAMDNTTIMEKFMSIMSYFAVKIEALMGWVRNLEDGFMKLADSLGGSLIPKVILAGMVFRTVMIPFNALVGTSFRGASGFSSFGAGVGGAVTGLSGLGPAAAIATIPLAALGVAIALIGTGVLGAGRGIAYMGEGVEKMAGVKISTLVSALHGLGGAVTALGSASSTHYKSINQLASALSMLSRSSANFEGIKTTVGVMETLSNRIKNLSTDKITTFNAEITKLARATASKNMTNSINNLYKMAAAATQVARSVEGIDVRKANVMDQIASGIKATVESAVSLSADPEAVNATTRIANAASRYATAINESRGNHTSALKSLIDTIATSISGGKTAGGGRGGGGVRSTANLSIYLGRRKFETAVVEVLEDGVFNLRQA